MERLQREFPDARFVKAFNQVNNSRMVNPQFGRITPTMFICGNHAEAKETVTRILDHFGWETEDMVQVKPLAPSNHSECFGRSAITCIRKWDHAFKLLKSK